MKVADLMHQQVRTVGENEFVTDAVRSLVDARVSALPVLVQHQAPVGVLTTKDVLRAEAERNSGGGPRWPFETTRVRTIMSSWMPPIPWEADVKEAAQTMLYLDVKRLFVVDGEHMVGVISQTDIVDALAGAKI